MTQLQSQTKTIGDHRFEVFKLPPFEAQDVLIDIGQIIAPALGKAAKAFTGDQQVDSLLDIDVENPHLATGIAELVRNITKPKMRELVHTMASVTHCDGTPLPKVMEITFRGDLPLMYQWLWFALEVNFGNFFPWLGTAIKDVSNQAVAARYQSTSNDAGRQ